MSELFARIQHEAATALSVWLVVFFVAVAVLQRLFARPGHRGLRVLGGLLGLHVVAVFGAGVVRSQPFDFANEAGVAARLTFSWSIVLGLGALLFDLLLARLRVRMNRIIEDLVVFGALAVVTVLVLRRTGVDLTGIVATSAVVTAVVGLSLQDTLGNTIGGLTLQLDDSIHVGDWIKVGDVTGRVVDIRWRFTAIETRNWETVLIPNSKLAKNDVVVLGQRQGQPRQLRRWVYFHVDFRTPPGDVVDTVLDALRDMPIPNVAAEPPPSCVLLELGESTARYAVRYWLTDIAADDPTDGDLRTRVFFALKRRGIPLAMPAQAVFVTEDSNKRRERHHAEERTRRLKALRRVELFAPLGDAECERVADALVHAPYARGERITRQGAEADWLYLVGAGRVAVRIAVDGEEREVAQIGAGEVFGEMSLLTGEPRAASVYALSDLDCWRLERDVFRMVLQDRPEVANEIAGQLSERRVRLEEVRGDLDAVARARRVEQEKTALVARMRSFFGL
ncbi:MAG: mechanosensitive ion channel [Deltaproteobacteria bacterium]|nr:mechanosensitive ion channel [Deltaproteobacteria bacterium]